MGLVIIHFSHNDSNWNFLGLELRRTLSKRRQCCHVCLLAVVHLHKLHTADSPFYCIYIFGRKVRFDHIWGCNGYFIVYLVGDHNWVVLYNYTSSCANIINGGHRKDLPFVKQFIKFECERQGTIF